MSGPCTLALLWHLHQPDYRDATGRPVMPWVRLHGLRGYRDLPALLLEHGLGGTINLVPSLCDQLAHYLDGGDDPHLALTERPAASCGPAERRALRHGFLAGHPAMIRAHAACAALQDRLGDEQPLTVQEILDLQVWATLAWVGPTGLAARPELVELQRKGRGFDEDDKRALLDAQRALLAEVPGLWRRFAGTWEVSASPAYHPILPLLVDLEHARRNLPDLPALPTFRFPGDAALQLARGKERVEREVGVTVRGLWPSEGSVSPEVVELAAAAGFRWLATDEEVWRRSERGPGSLDQPWQLADGLVGLFRDHGLSDHIGFRTAGRGPAAAAELAGALRRRAGTVLLALDGENPWEAHPDGGQAFLTALAVELRRAGVRSVSCGEAAEGPAGEMTRLHTGSWIGADFRIWAGDRDDHAAWALLAETRAAVAEAGDPPEALEPVLAAEGSDWFWWYGPEFETEHAAHFDALFRAHLRAAWQAIGRPPPPALARPVAGARHHAGGWPATRIARRRPVAPLDWTGAGFEPTDGPQGSMATATRTLRGFDWLPGRRRCWLRLHLDADVQGTVVAHLPGGDVELPLAPVLELPVAPPFDLSLTLSYGSGQLEVTPMPVRVTFPMLAQSWSA